MSGGQNFADRPLTVQGDHTVLLEVNAAGFAEARDYLSSFAELEKSPEFFHTYRITPLSIWNAAAAGLDDTMILEFLGERSRYPVPPNVEKGIRENIRKYGLLRLERHEDSIFLSSSEPKLLKDLIRNPTVKKLVDRQIDDMLVAVPAENRGEIKQALIRVGYPVEDLAGYAPGTPFSLSILDTCRNSGEPFGLRPYQRDASDVFHAGGSERVRRWQDDRGDGRHAPPADADVGADHQRGGGPPMEVRDPGQDRHRRARHRRIHG